MQQSIRVLLVDDQVLFREGLAQLLSSQEDMQIVGEAGDGLEAVEKAKELRPDLIVMDIRMPSMNGLEACRAIKLALPETRIVMLTVSDSDEDLFQAIKYGATGYLLKNLKARRLFDQLRSAYRGEAALSPYLAMRVLEEFARERRREETTSGYRGRLTDREKEILQLVVNGLTNKEIGGQVGIAESTVKRHIHNILEKLQMDNRVQAAAYAVRSGLVSSEDMMSADQG
jgi:two-component system nitrate/nitrite response regulator NarL